MSFWSSIGDMIWWFLTAFIFLVYLIALFSIVSDLFRDRNLNGFAKAVWLFFLIFVPFITALAYLIFRGYGMSERFNERAQLASGATEPLSRSGTGPSGSALDDIMRAKELLESGAITAEEYEALKQSALRQAESTR